MEWSKGCNVCEGTGIAEKWPTDWQPHQKDIIPVSEVLDELDCHTLVLPGEVLHTEVYIPDAPIGESFKKTEFATKTVKQVLSEKGITRGYLVTVDYHN